jgi:glycosyltransferase involved in cell wall biosynthesis
MDVEPAHAAAVVPALETSRMRMALIGRDAHRVLAFRGSLIRAAQAAGHEVLAITGRDERGARSRLKSAGVQLLEAPLDPASMNPWKDRVYGKWIEDTLRGSGVEAVLAYNPKCLAHGTVAARRAGVTRVIGMVTGLGHGFIGDGLGAWWVRRAKAMLFRRAFDHCDAILIQNEEDRRELALCGALRADAEQRVVMIPGSGVDLDQFRPAPLPSHAAFLMVSRPLREKGLPEYLQACRIARATLPDATFAWLGPLHDANPSAMHPGELLRSLEQSGVEHLNETEDIRPAIAACSVLVLPSHREGTSKVVIEAMAMGRPIITCDAPGCRETVSTGENGWLVPVGDPEALAEAMRRLGKDAAARAAMGAASARLADRRFDASKADRLVLDLLEGNRDSVKA